MHADIVPDVAKFCCARILLQMVAALLQNHYSFQNRKPVNVSCGLWLKYRLIPFFATQLMKLHENNIKQMRIKTEQVQFSLPLEINL